MSLTIPLLLLTLGASALGPHDTLRGFMGSDEVVPPIATDRVITLDKIEYRFDGHRDALHMNFLDQSIAVPSEPYVPKVSPNKKYLIGRCIYNAAAFVRAAKANKTPKCLREIPKDKYVGHARLLGFVSNTGAIFKHGYCCGSSHYTYFNIATGVRRELGISFESKRNERKFPAFRKLKDGL